MTEITTRYRIRLRLDPEDSLNLRAKHFYEKHESDLLVGALHAGDCFVDVGAHIGYHATLAASLVGPAGLVLAYEPSPANFEVLAANIRLNGFAHAAAMNIAVSDRSGYETLHFSRSSSADHRTYEVRGDPRRSMRVPSRTLDEMLSGIDLAGRGLFVKVDTQGFEIRVLRGARQTLARRPVRMIVELYPFGLEANGGSCGELLEELRGLGFEFLQINRQGKGLMRFPPSFYSENYTAKRGNHCNLYCIKE